MLCKTKSLLQPLFSIDLKQIPVITLLERSDPEHIDSLLVGCRPALLACYSIRFDIRTQQLDEVFKGTSSSQSMEVFCYELIICIRL